MKNKLNKNQWVAVVVSIIVVAIIIFISFRSSDYLKVGSESIDQKITYDRSGKLDLTKIPVIKESDSSTDSLVVEDLAVGEGKEALAGKTVVVNYEGFLTDNTKFDSTWDRGVPFEFKLGEGFVILGWEEGVIGMKEGGLRRLVIPPQFAYGEGEVGPIPANSTLIFVIELLEVKN